MRRLPACLGVLAAGFLILAIPPPDPAPPAADTPVPPSAGEFAWNADTLWHALEARYAEARRRGCDGIVAAASRRIAALEAETDALSGRAAGPDDPGLDSLEARFFAQAPEAAACPALLRRYQALSGRLRAAIKRQSRGWDLRERRARVRLYRALYGGRAAVEEAMLQHPDSIVPLETGTAEPSATPGAARPGGARPLGRHSGLPRRGPHLGVDRPRERLPGQLLPRGPGPRRPGHPRGLGDRGAHRARGRDRVGGGLPAGQEAAGYAPAAPGGPARPRRRPAPSPPGRLADAGAGPRRPHSVRLHHGLPRPRPPLLLRGGLVGVSGARRHSVDGDLHHDPQRPPALAHVVRGPPFRDPGAVRPGVRSAARGGGRVAGRGVAAAGSRRQRGGGRYAGARRFRRIADVPVVPAAGRAARQGDELGARAGRPRRAGPRGGVGGCGAPHPVVLESPAPPRGPGRHGGGAPGRGRGIPAALLDARRAGAGGDRVTRIGPESDVSGKSTSTNPSAPEA